MKLGQFADMVLPTLNITNKTKKNYFGAFNVNIRPKFGERNLAELTKQEFIQTLSALSPQTNYQTLMVLRVLYGAAVELELVDRNIPKSIKAPRIKIKPQKFLTWEELKVLNFGKQTKRIKFLALHGLRYGEAVSLTEADIQDGFVNITKSKYGPTKTLAGVRKVPLLSEFVKFARHQKALSRALKTHGVTVHSLRKTYAYMLKTSGVHVTTAAKLMGHANPMVTLRIYTQVRDDETTLASTKLKAYLSDSQE